MCNNNNNSNNNDDNNRNGDQTKTADMTVKWLTN